MPVKWTTWRKGQILKRVQSIKTETGEKKKKNRNRPANWTSLVV